MILTKKSVAGTMESSDVMVTIEPSDKNEIEIELESSVMSQFGRQIIETTKKTLEEINVSCAKVKIQDKGANDFTIKARILAAAYRSSDAEEYKWEA